MRSLHSNIGPTVMLGPVVLDADNTPAAFDLLGFESAAVLIAVGVGGITFDATNKIEFKLRHGDTATAADHIAVEQADVLGATVGSGGIVHSLVSAHASPTVTKLSYIGNRRYLSVLADFGGTHAAGTPVTVLVLKGHPHVAPVP